MKCILMFTYIDKMFESGSTYLHLTLENDKKGRQMEQVVKDRVKKEWKTWVVAVWMVVVTGFLFYINTKIDSLGDTDESIVSNIDSIESIIISTDAATADISKKVNEIEKDVTFIVRKVKRR